MPYIELKTNINLEKSIKNEISKELGKEIELLGKSENWLMINVIDKQDMYFNGNDRPCIIAEVKVYGGVDDSEANKFTNKLTDTINKLTGIEKNRIYINYFGTNNWGYSGFNF